MSPDAVISKMMNGDAFSQWLGIEVVALKQGYVKLRLHVRDEMVNGFNIAHGGITYSLADSALAFAANSYGRHCVSIETSISHTRPVNTDDELSAECIELNRGRSIGIYQVIITNQDDKKVALFKGTVHISDRDWEAE
jgi:acyl-CoA thioesterase